MPTLHKMEMKQLNIHYSYYYIYMVRCGTKTREENPPPSVVQLEVWMTMAALIRFIFKNPDISVGGKFHIMLR